MGGGKGMLKVGPSEHLCLYAFEVILDATGGKTDFMILIHHIKKSITVE
jgi:hypothetical protein